MTERDAVTIETAWLVCEGSEICAPVDATTRGKAIAKLIRRNSDHWDFDWKRMRAYRMREWDGLSPQEVSERHIVNPGYPGYRRDD